MILIIKCRATGDAYAELVKRADGAPGALPRALLEVPTVEVQIALAPRSEGLR